MISAKKTIYKICQSITAIKTLLRNIDECYGITVSNSSSETVALSGSARLIVIGIGGDKAKFVALVNCTSGGVVTHLKVAGEPNITITNGTNSFTINNGYGYTMSVLIIKYVQV